MLTISKNLLWPRDLESFIGGNFNTLSQIFDVFEQRMSEVRKGTSRNTENENKRCKIFNKVLNMNWDYVRGKKQNKRKIKINKQKGNKQTKKLKKN
jgi:hypothetical protein